ncbi:hypothetical protein [Spirillospora albida]|uniref:hypothetical protein n=1 Tax=Spirillospora albida TaxID=58123 RepID=UPI0012F90387|nr:hypothetical protein [Spirillospora albida]
MDPQTAHDTDRLRALAAEFTDWRVGHGGSGLWWAVRHNDLVREPTPEILRDRLRELAT